MEVGQREDGIFSERADVEAEFRGRRRRRHEVRRRSWASKVAVMVVVGGHL